MSETPDTTDRDNRITEIREILGFDDGIASRDDGRLEYDELSTIVRELRGDGSLNQNETYDISLSEDQVIGAIAALTLYAADTPFEADYKGIARSVEQQARAQGLTHPVEEDSRTNPSEDSETDDE